MVKITIITGNAGTGKSYKLAKYINMIHNRNKSFVVLAFTHSAVDNIRQTYNNLYPPTINDKFMTIHKYFRINIANNIIQHNKFDHLDYIFIDEYSLISIDLFNIIFNAIKTSADKLILCGDYKQLHSIDTKEYITYDNLYKYINILANNYNITPDIINVFQHFDNSILSLPIIRNNTEDLIILSEQKRSSDNIMELVNNVVFLGNDIPLNLFITKTTITNLILNNNYIFIASKYKTLQEIHDIISNNIQKETYVINNYTTSYKSSLKKLKLYKGQELTITANTEYFINGETYTFIEYDDKNNYILLYSNETNEYKYLHRMEEDEEVTNEVTHKNKYFPVIPTYLTTFHKSQGKTYENVIICVDNLFDFTMLYTGITRAKKDVLFYTETTNQQTNNNNSIYYNMLDDLVKYVYKL